MMDMVYVCSPYKGDTEKNVKNVKHYCRIVTCYYKVPIAPHLYFTQFLNDDDSFDRIKGMEMGLSILPLCKEIWVIADEVTEGMIKEIKEAEKLGLQFKFMNSDMEEINYDALIINKRIGPGLRKIIEDIVAGSGKNHKCICSGKCRETAGNTVSSAGAAKAGSDKAAKSIWDRIFK